VLELVALLLGGFFVYNCAKRVKAICKREALRELRHKKRLQRLARNSDKHS
jgi:hypothetical protein